MKSRILSKFSLLLVFEILLLVLSLHYDVIVGVTFFSLVILVLGYLYFYKQPFHLLIFILFSMLIGSFGGVKTGGKSFGMSSVDLTFTFGLFVLLIRLIVGWPEKTKFPKYFWAYTLFICWTLLGSLLAHDRMRAIAGWHNHFFSFISCVFAYNVVSSRKLKNLLITAVILWGLFLALQQIYYISQLGNLKQSMAMLIIRKNLVGNSWGKSNYLAAFFVLIIPITLSSLLSSGTIKGKLLLSLILTALSATMILTLSRGGIIALLIALLIFLFKIIRLRTFFPILIILISLGFLIVYNPFTSILSKRISEANKTDSYFSRVNLYNDIGTVITEHPIEGVGLVNLGYYMKFKSKDGVHAHNLVLGMLGETGLIGSLLYFIFLLYLFYSLVKAYIRVHNLNDKLFLWGGICSYIGCLIHSMVEPTFDGLYFGIIFWFVFGTFLRFIDNSTNPQNMEESRV
ncbi:MAG: O-antigen ligase family protein [Ignavibacteria bacterium]|nr:O-antigen ligase family protein [Ignavibacteria bacterium]